MKTLTAALCLALVASFSNTSVGQATVTVGNGSLVNTTTTYPAPLGNWYWGSRQQFLYTAADLSSACVSPGATITKIGFFVNTVSGAALQGYTIEMANTLTADLGAAWEGSLTNVFTPTLVTPVAGWNTLTLTTPFVWDGVSNLVVDCCFQNGSYTTNCLSPQTATPFVSTRLFRVDAAGNCGNLGLTATYSQRPNTQFEVSAISGASFEPNQGDVATLLINNTVGTPCLAPAVTTQASGSIVLASNRIGSPWDVFYNFAPQVPNQVVLTDGQIVNLDLSGPLYALNGVFGANWPGAGVPGITNSTLTITYAALPPMFTVTMQAAWFDPANMVNGLALSQATTIAVP
jgi:hypothetical protein